MVCGRRNVSKKLEEIIKCSSMHFDNIFKKKRNSKNEISYDIRSNCNKTCAT